MNNSTDSEPEAYAIGFVPFLNTHIDLSKKPLIPRVETEYWVELAIKEIKNKIVQNHLTEIKVLDIFSGSGCIGLAVLKSFENDAGGEQNVCVDFVDSENNCLEQIKINADINNISAERYKIIQSDVFEKVPPENPPNGEAGKYDFILANPPYIPAGRKDELDKSVTDYEPHQALFSGADGLDLIKKFLAEAKKYLKPKSELGDSGGQIWLEFDTGQEKEIETLLLSFGYQNWQFYPDQYGRMRYVVIRA